MMRYVDLRPHACVSTSIMEHLSHAGRHGNQDLQHEVPFEILERPRCVVGLEDEMGWCGCFVWLFWGQRAAESKQG